MDFDPLSPPLLLSSVTKICAQCEMEHSADGLMEQMCSSDFGECRDHVATALSPEKCTSFLHVIPGTSKAPQGHGPSLARAPAALP